MLALLAGSRGAHGHVAVGYRRLDAILPFLQREEGVGSPIGRGGALSVLWARQGAQSRLSAALVMMVPFPFCLMRPGRKRKRGGGSPSQSLVDGCVKQAVSAQGSSDAPRRGAGISVAASWRRCVRLWPTSCCRWSIETRLAAPGTLGSLKNWPFSPRGRARRPSRARPPSHYVDSSGRTR